MSTQFAAVDIDQLRNEIAMELEDDELRILARIDNVVERQLRLLQIEERKHIHLILDLRDKLNDANLAVHTRHDTTRPHTCAHTLSHT